MTKILMLTISFLVLASGAGAQTFSSGSTGADGPLDLTSGDRTVQLPESGVLNYTTVNIPSGKTLRFARNSRNTPVYLLAQGNVNIAGGINVSACGSGFGCSPSAPGPGGFYGGQPSLPGFGPGGGTASHPDAVWIGPLSLVPIIGGSGGYSNSGQGNGGGAITIASSTSINFSGFISAAGSAGCFTGCSSFGSGGAIRLVANFINASGTLTACTPFNSSPCGVIRLEAPVGSLTFNGTSLPAAVLSTVNPAVVSTSPPSLTILTVGGFAVPSYAGQRFDAVDMLLPNQLPDPIAVIVQGSNIPVGTQVQIGFLNGSPSATTTPATLQGTFASSTATPTIANLNRGAVTYLLASATFEPPPSAPGNQKGANYVDKVRVESLIGTKPKFVFLRKDGSEIKPEMLAREFLQQFGQ